MKAFDCNGDFPLDECDQSKSTGCDFTLVGSKGHWLDSALYTKQVSDLSL
jgi:hypothetical protein